MKCADCKNCNAPDGELEFCIALLWDREEDDFIKSEKDFDEYINKERICSDFHP